MSSFCEEKHALMYTSGRATEFPTQTRGEGFLIESQHEPGQRLTKVA